MMDTDLTDTRHTQREGRQMLACWAKAKRGRQIVLAHACGVRPPVVNAWLAGRKPIPEKHGATVERNG